MKVLTITEFQKYCKKVAPVSFIYDTNNQINGVRENLKMVSKYSDIIFLLNPNRICLKNDCGTLCFDRVKLIRFYDEEQMVGKVFSIICGNKNNSDFDISYTILMDKINIK